MWELLWLHSWQYGCVRFDLTTTKKWLCDLLWLRSWQYGCVRYVCLPKKNVCTTSYGSAPGNMVASINLATAKKMVAWPPMVARHPMVPLLAIWLRLLTWLPPKKMVARPPMVAQPPMVVLKTDKIQTINWSHVGINRWHHQTDAIKLNLFIYLRKTLWMSVSMHDKLCQNYTWVGETLVEHPNYHHVCQGTPNVAIMQWAHSIAI